MTICSMRAVAALSLALAFTASSVGAQSQSKAQQKCINVLNKGMAKVSKTQAKAGQSCSSKFAKGKEADADTCAFSAAKVDTARTKNCDAETKSCTTPMVTPDFGKTSCGSVNAWAEGQTSSLLYNLIGFPLNTNLTPCSTSKAACKCEAFLIKSANKLLATYAKDFNKCKKTGLKNGSIMSAANLNSCVGIDAKGKIAKLEGKILGQLPKRCGGISPALPHGLCNAAVTDLGVRDCVRSSVRCSFCSIAAGSDALTVNCELFDDGLANSSCSND